jgi:hypothetical protein
MRVTKKVLYSARRLLDLAVRMEELGDVVSAESTFCAAVEAEARYFATQ